MIKDKRKVRVVLLLFSAVSFLCHCHQSRGTPATFKNTRHIADHTVTVIRTHNEIVRLRKTFLRPH